MIEEVKNEFRYKYGDKVVYTDEQVQWMSTKKAYQILEMRRWQTRNEMINGLQNDIKQTSEMQRNAHKDNKSIYSKQISKLNKLLKDYQEIK